MMTPHEYRQQAAAKRAEAEKIRTAHETLSDEHFEAIEALIAEANELTATAERLEAIDRALKPGSGDKPPVVPAVSVQERWLGDPRRGWTTPRQFLEDVMRWTLSPASLPSETQQRLQSLAHADDGAGFMLPVGFAPRRFAIGSDEASITNAPSGGYLAPPPERLPLRELVWEGDPTDGLTMRIPMRALTVDIPARVDEDHTTSVTGGFRVYRTAEMQTVEASRATFRMVSLKADKLMGISFATSEILRWSPESFAGIIERGLRTEFASRILDEKLRGTGVGEYLGVLNSPALITVAKETGQAAATVVYANLVKMRARIWRGASRPIWLLNSDVLAQLLTLTDASGRIIWQPNASEGSPMTLLGYPIVECESCSALGTVGDIILANWGEYLEGVASPVEGASSIHVRFLNDQTAFRFTTYVCGAPWWRAPLQPKHGSTRSPFVALATRS